MVPQLPPLVRDYHLVYGRHSPDSGVPSTACISPSLASLPSSAPTSAPTPPLEPRLLSPALAPPSEPHRPVTRSATGTIPRVQYRNLNTIAASPAPPSIPANYRSGLADANSRVVMTDEFKALVDNDTWHPVPRSLGANVVTCKWIFKHKFHSDDTLSRHMAHWVVCGFSQRHDIDYGETFNPVVKPATIRMVLSVATSSAWSTNQLHVKNAFLHGHLNETVYCQQPLVSSTPPPPITSTFCKSPCTDLSRLLEPSTSGLLRSFDSLASSHRHPTPLSLFTKRVCRSPTCCSHRRHHPQRLVLDSHIACHDQTHL